MLLRPKKQVRAIVEYCLAEAVTRFGITLNAWDVMGNHLHLLLRDERGNYPDFLAHLFKMIAKVLNAHWGRRENFWSSEQANVVWVVTPQDAFDKLIYLLVNPVAADLVERAEEWPGASSLEQNTSRDPRPVTLERPSYFRATGKMPKSAVLRADRLAGFEDMSAGQWAKKVREAVRLAEEEHRKRRKANGTRVLGVRAVLEAEPTTIATRPERRGRLFPHIACRDVELRKRELRAMLEFRVTVRRTAS